MHSSGKFVLRVVLVVLVISVPNPGLLITRLCGCRVVVQDIMPWYLLMAMSSH
jgi:hypothetical protein